MSCAASPVSTSPDDHRGRVRSAYARVLDFAGLRAIADEVGAYLVVDMAHFAGLVASGIYPDPLPHAHVVTSTTYKSLRGARGGLVLWKRRGAERQDQLRHLPGRPGLGDAAHRGRQGGLLRRSPPAGIQGLQPGGARQRPYARRHAGRGRHPPGRRRHGLRADARRSRQPGHHRRHRREGAGACGAGGEQEPDPFDERPPEAPSGLRLSSNAGTARGFGAEEFRAIGTWIAQIVKAPSDEALIRSIHGQVSDLCARFPIYA